MFAQWIVRDPWKRLARAFSLANPGALIVLALGLLLTLAAATYLSDTADNDNQKYFERRVAEAEGTLAQHVRLHFEVLRGLQGLFRQAEQPVTREAFRRYIEHLDLEGRYHGIQALSFTRYLRSGERAAFEAAIRGDTALARPDFAVKPAGERPDYFVADFIGPESPDNTRVFGLDLGSEAIRRATFERARDTGRPSASQRITLTMRNDGPQGFFMAAPVYRRDLPVRTVEERRRAFLGCVTAVFRSAEMMNGLFGMPLLSELDIEIYDAPAAAGNATFSTEHLLFDSATAVAGSPVALHAATQTVIHRKLSTVDVADRQWSVVYTGLPSLVAPGHGNLKTWLVLGGGAAMSLLLFVLVASISDANKRLESEVAERTAALVASNAELAESVSQLTALNHALQNTQNQLLQAEKMASIGQLAAGVAHEINNPIGFVNSNLGSLRGHVDGLLAVLAAYAQAEGVLAEHPEALRRIRAEKAAVDFEFLQQDVVDLIAESLDGVQRVKMIVQDLKDFSRVDTAEWHVANLESGLDSTLNIVRNEIKYKADVVKEYAGLPEIECIGSQLNQVFMNLLVNAAHAIETHGTITIRTGVDATRVWVEIADTGKGIPPEIRERIFEPFFTTKPIGQGTGLGLSLACSIVQRHQGTLDADSEVGRGTRFRITLPRQRVREPVVEGRGAAVCPMATGGR